MHTEFALSIDRNEVRIWGISKHSVKNTTLHHAYYALNGSLDFCRLPSLFAANGRAFEVHRNSLGQQQWLNEHRFMYVNFRSTLYLWNELEQYSSYVQINRPCLERGTSTYYVSQMLYLMMEKIYYQDKIPFLQSASTTDLNSNVHL